VILGGAQRPEVGYRGGVEIAITGHSKVAVRVRNRVAVRAAALVHRVRGLDDLLGPHRVTAGRVTATAAARWAWRRLMPGR